MGKVYGLENKEGYFYDFVKNTFAVWSHQCALPSKQLADDILLIHTEDELEEDISLIQTKSATTKSVTFNGVRVVPVPVSD